jgi:hypothetical protein
MLRVLDTVNHSQLHKTQLSSISINITRYIIVAYYAVNRVSYFDLLYEYVTKISGFNLQVYFSFQNWTLALECEHLQMCNLIVPNPIQTSWFETQGHSSLQPTGKAPE